ncbi:hypothetical protein SLA_0219 [Streptomyces laurentii]|uniref:Major facilitator superfamily (MFS) profile domain-containing protein n=1 Tax=Streptomyces laurentii TaxID=39478 RepID=A0A160NTP8_STRLU|nr:hypothetical protein SLA_0219 [Streptomyces laurentii]
MSELRDAHNGSGTGPDPVESTRRLPLALVYAAGVIAAMGLGKFDVFAVQLQDDLEISLGQVGWVVSAITGISALLGTPAGLWLGRRSMRGTLLTGLWCVAAAGAGGGLAPGLGALLPLRAAEGIGYLMVVIACPTLIVRLSAPPDRGPALALWGTFVPVGLALSTALGGAVGSVTDWRGWMFVMAALTALPATVLTFTRLGTLAPATPRPSAKHRTARPGNRPLVVLLALGFCMVSLVTVAVFVLIPIFLQRELGYSRADAGATAGFISLVSVGGGFLIGWLMHRKQDVRPVALGSFLVVIAAWVAFRAGVGTVLFIAGAATISGLNGVMVGLILASVPRLAAESGDLGLANGIVTQGGSLGSLLGPPLFNAGVEHWGWHAVGWFSTAGMAVCWLLMAPTVRPSGTASAAPA